MFFSSFIYFILLCLFLRVSDGISSFLFSLYPFFLSFSAFFVLVRYVCSCPHLLITHLFCTHYCAYAFNKTVSPFSSHIIGCVCMCVYIYTLNIYYFVICNLYRSQYHTICVIERFSMTLFCRFSFFRLRFFEHYTIFLHR